jgi:hypothetical protein
MSDTLLFIIGSFATYRISRMIGERTEEGPFSIFSKLRAWLNINSQDTWWRRGLMCPKCISVWVGIALGLILWGLTFESVLAGLAFSGVTVLVHAIAG